LKLQEESELVLTFDSITLKRFYKEFSDDSGEFLRGVIALTRPEA
jgi:hypothetical protein